MRNQLAVADETTTAAREGAPHVGPSLSTISQRRWCIVIGIGAIVVGVLTALYVIPGLPSDEPAHWLNVIYYGAHHRMPRVGSPGASYEAVQGPVAYIPLALVAGAVRSVASNPSLPFYAARMVDGIEFLLAAVVLWRLLGRLVAPSPGRVVALACFVLSPMLVAMSWSVENDIAGVLVSFLVLDLVLSRGFTGFDLRWALLAGLLTGVAVVTTLTAWPLVASVPLWLYFCPGGSRHVRRVVSLALIFWIGVAATSGWWFVRNLMLYHHLVAVNTVAGTAAALRANPTSPGIGVHGIHTVSRVVEELVTFLWVPTEYYRDLIHLPAPVKGVIALATAYAVMVGGSVVLKKIAFSRPTDRSNGLSLDPSGHEAWISAWILLGVTGTVAVVGWAVIFVWITALAGRFAYLELPLWVGLIAVAVNYMAGLLRRVPVWLFPLATVAVLLLANVWFVHAGHHVSIDPFRISFPPIRKH